MGFFKTKHGLIFSVLVLCLVLSLFSVTSYAKKNSNYERYLSESIGNTMRSMGSDIEKAKIILEKSNSSGTISKEDLNSLYVYHNNFLQGLQNAFHMYEMTKRGTYKPVYANSNYRNLYNELTSLNGRIQQSDEPIYKITDDDKHLFEQLGKMNNEFAAVFGSDFYNWDFSISKDKWIDALKKVDSISNKTYN